MQSSDPVQKREIEILFLNQNQYSCRINTLNLALARWNLATGCLSQSANAPSMDVY